MDKPAEVASNGLSPTIAALGGYNYSPPALNSLAIDVLTSTSILPLAALSSMFKTLDDTNSLLNSYDSFLLSETIDFLTTSERISLSSLVFSFLSSSLKSLFFITFLANPLTD